MSKPKSLRAPIVRDFATMATWHGPSKENFHPASYDAADECLPSYHQAIEDTFCNCTTTRRSLDLLSHSSEATDHKRSDPDSDCATASTSSDSSSQFSEGTEHEESNPQFHDRQTSFVAHRTLSTNVPSPQQTADIKTAPFKPQVSHIPILARKAMRPSPDAAQTVSRTLNGNHGTYMASTVCSKLRSGYFPSHLSKWQSSLHIKPGTGTVMKQKTLWRLSKPRVTAQNIEDIARQPTTFSESITPSKDPEMTRTLPSLDLCASKENEEGAGSTSQPLNHATAVYPLPRKQQENSLERTYADPNCNRDFRDHLDFATSLTHCEDSLAGARKELDSAQQRNLALWKALERQSKKIILLQEQLSTQSNHTDLLNFLVKGFENILKPHENRIASTIEGPREQPLDVGEVECNLFLRRMEALAGELDTVKKEMENHESEVHKLLVSCGAVCELNDVSIEGGLKVLGRVLKHDRDVIAKLHMVRESLGH